MSDLAERQVEAAAKSIKALEQLGAATYTQMAQVAISAAAMVAKLETSTERRRLDEVRHALFPPPVPRGDGSETDYSADENLEAAIISLEHRNADAVSIGTLKKVLSRLVAARAVMDEKGTGK